MAVETLEGEVAIVTGGGRGYGKGVAAKIKEHGGEVWITGRDPANLEAAAAELNCQWLKADVSSAEDWDRLIDKVMVAHGRLDILVNNAGVGGQINDCDTLAVDDIERTIAVNLTGCVFGCRLAAGIMKKQKSGTIINISSVCARQAWPGWSVYSAAKAGVVQFGKSLYVELRPHGVRVTTVMPSWGATGFIENAGLPAFDESTAAKCISPEELGDQVASICMLPNHLCVQDLTLLPLVQEINPL